jgi:hypothetical protein
MKPVNYVWPAQVTNLIAPLQSTSGAGNLILPVKPFSFGNISRSKSSFLVCEKKTILTFSCGYIILLFRRSLFR